MDRDDQERLELWAAYGDEQRCIGEHIVQGGYCCMHCGSDDPDSVCHKEEVRHYSHDPDDYVEESMQNIIARYKVIGQDPKSIPVEMEANPAWVGTCPECEADVEIDGDTEIGKCFICDQAIKVVKLRNFDK